MAVSLKKSVKVDLSKPELPQKMREYTPIHLMDEEESIQKRVRQTMSLPCDNPNIQIKSESGGISSAARIKHVSSHLAEKSTHKSDGQAEPPTDENDDFTEAQESTPKRTVETESQTDTEVDTCCKSSKLGRCLMKAFCVLSPLIACAVSIFSLYALPNMLASVCPTDGLEGEIFSIVKSVFTNPIVALMLIILWLSVFVRNIRKVGKM